jgi:hypothetical protein
MYVADFHLTVKRGTVYLAALMLSPAIGFSSAAGTANSQPQPVVIIDRTLSAEDIDPAVYFDFDDPTDPFREVYAAFRARRAGDMADASKPPPI